jgi:hypothetical protein
LVRALLDTGSTVTAVAPVVLRKLGATSKGQALTHTASGQSQVQLYHVSITILESSHAGGQAFTLPSVWATELSVTLPDADVLIGLNVLRHFETLLDGPGGAFSVDF